MGTSFVHEVVTGCCTLNSPEERIDEKLAQPPRLWSFHDNLTHTYRVDMPRRKLATTLCGDSAVPFTKMRGLSKLPLVQYASLNTRGSPAHMPHSALQCRPSNKAAAA